MLRKPLGQIALVVAAVVVASAANAVPITFTIEGGSATTSGIAVGSTVTVTPSATLAGRTFELSAANPTSGIFDFLDVSVTGVGAVGGFINSSLDFATPDVSANGVLGGFGVILGWASGGLLTVLSDPGPIAFGTDGWFDVDFFGFSDSCMNCTSLSGTVTARVTLLREPTSVPEPATLSLLGAGLLAVGFARRRKRV